MTSFIQSEEFVKLEVEYPFLRRAREHFSGLHGLEAVIVDIETTGLEPTNSEIIEIAALQVEKNEITNVFSSLINIHQPVPPEIVQLTGITTEMLGEGREKVEILKNFLRFVDGKPLIAHNTDFDIPFLNHHLKKELDVTLVNPLICTLKISRKLLPGLSSHKLARVAEYFKVPTPLTHRAPGDVEITHQIWLRFIDLLEKANINNLEELLKFAT